MMGWYHKTLERCLQYSDNQNTLIHLFSLPQCVPWPFIHWTAVLEDVISAWVRTLLVSWAMSGQRQDLTEHVMDRTSSSENPTAISSFQIAGNWTPDVLSLLWHGSITKDAQAPSSTTCQTAGACIFGWFPRERCLHDLRVEGDGVSPKLW